MKRLNFLSILLFFTCFCFSQNLLYDITDGQFRAKRGVTPNSMNDGKYYTLLVDNQKVVKCDYRTGEAVETLFDAAEVKDFPSKNIQGYELSPNEKKMLVFINAESRYRRSYTADYYVFDVARKEIIPLSENGAQECPLFSPDSRYIAFARDNNLYMNKLDYNTELAITKDGQAGKIINGIADWVYEEEFSQVRYFEWSPDSKLLAFVRFDEIAVPEFSMPIFNTSENPNAPTLYPEILKFKYPKAGEINSKVSVLVYDDFYKQLKTMKLGDSKETDFYIPRIKWTSSEEQLAVFQLNRNQNRLDMYLANPKSTIGKMIFRQEDARYVDYENADYTFFSPDNQYFITVTETDGFRHAYRYNMSGTLAKQLTKGAWDITDVYGYDFAKKVLYFQSADASPLQRDVCAVDFNGKITKLTDGKGTHNANFNADFSLFTDNSSSLEKPNVVTLRNINGKSVRVIENNAALAEKFQSLQLPHKEFFTFTTSENVQLNGWILKPKNFDKNKKYPLLLVQYSGPNSQEVLDRWTIDWEYYLAENQYIVASVDGRGTGARGADFRKCTYQELGSLETRDQIEAAKYFGNQSFIDKGRIGIWGWSFGGYMTLSALSAGGEPVFKAGIAVAPVTDWRFYDSAYTERFMRTPQENYRGYDKGSLLQRAENLQGNLLIVHATADDNVHVQNTMDYVARLVEANKQFEMQIYPDKNHSILGQQTRRHLYTRMSEFLFKNL